MRELEHGKRGDEEPTWSYRPERTEQADLAEGIAELPTDEMLINWREANEYDGLADRDDDLYDIWNPIEQGMYDDDPSPYGGTYSED